MAESEPQISEAKAKAKEAFTKLAGPAADNPALNELFAGDGDVTPARTEPEAKPKPEPPKPAAEKAPEPEADVEFDEDELREARAEALRSPVLTPEVVDALSPAQLLDAAAKAKEARAERDREVRAIKDAQKASSASETEASSQTAVPEASPSIDLEALVSPFIKRLDEGDTEHAQKDLVKIIQAAVGDAESRLEAKLSQERSQREGNEAEAQGRLLIDRARVELGGSHPELVDDAVYEAKIRPEVESLLRTGDYGPQNVSSLMKKAYLLGLGRGPRTPVKDNRKRDKARASGQLTPVTTTRDVPTPSTPKERAYAKFMEMTPR